MPQLLRVTRKARLAEQQPKQPRPLQVGAKVQLPTLAGVAKLPKLAGASLPQLAGALNH